MVLDLFRIARKRAGSFVEPMAYALNLPRSDARLVRQSSLFDAAYYLNENPDVADAAVDPAIHYIRHGWKEGRQPGPMFDGNRYLEDYPDVRLASVNPLVHYIKFGDSEGRQTHAVTLPGADRKTNRATSHTGAQPGLSVEKAREIIAQSGLFDRDLYLQLYPDLAILPDPLDHYVRHGSFEGRRAHRLFDGHWYASAYRDVAQSGLQPLVHYITIGKAEGRRCGLQPRILDKIEKMVAEAGELESTILLDATLVEPALLGFNYGGQSWPGIVAWQKLFDSLPHAFDHIVFVPWLVRGGADLAAANAVRAAIQHHGNDSTLVVLTDHDRSDSIDWLPVGAHVRVLSEFGSSLTRSDRIQMVESLILALRPKSVLNVNSGACWDSIVQKGAALGKVTNLYACLFCRDYTADGRAAGYADTHFRDSLPFLTKVYFDNAGFMHELADDYGVPESLRARMITLHQPIGNVSIGKFKTGSPQGNRIIWAGRFCMQKNVDLLIEIAQLATDFHFDIYGYGDDAYLKKLRTFANVLPNLTIKGPFSATSELPVDEYNAFLYTSLWDGLPLTLADVACMGIPVVASAVGGIPDLVTEQTGWLIQDYKDAAPYVDALREIRRSPDEARQRARRMMAWVRQEHSWDHFCKTLSVSPSFLD
ncbi:UNVERIFIED_ORG: glycosyltransferase involved in cell wall biosynthesis [Burkholderia sp. 1263]